MRLASGGASATLALLCSIFTAMPVLAQTGASAGNDAAQNSADAEESFRYAAKAAEAGDIVGAIAALERILQNNPDLSNIKLELGLLYLRAGNADLARSYLRQAVNAPDAPEAARQRARLALGAASSASGGFTVGGTIFGSFQVQSNPNGSPGSVSVIGPGGLPIIVSGDDLAIPRGSDISVNLAGAFEIRHGLGGQRPDDVVLALYMSQTNYADTTDLDATYLDARIGPRFFTGSTQSPTGYIRPFVSATGLALGHARYFAAFGGGGEFLFRPSFGANITGQLGYERRDYNNSNRRPTADEQSGDYFSGVLEYSQQVSTRLRGSASFLFEGVEADRDYWSRTTLGGQMGLIYSFASSAGGDSWVARLNGAYRRSDYSEPDPLVDAAVKRNEDRIDLVATLAIPVAKFLSLDLRVAQTWNNSNLPNYEFNNTQGGFGLTYRF